MQLLSAWVKNTILCQTIIVHRECSMIEIHLCTVSINLHLFTFLCVSVRIFFGRKGEKKPFHFDANTPNIFRYSSSSLSCQHIVSLTLTPVLNHVTWSVRDYIHYSPRCMVSIFVIHYDNLMTCLSFTAWALACLLHSQIVVHPIDEEVVHPPVLPPPPHRAQPLEPEEGHGTQEDGSEHGANEERRGRSWVDLIQIFDCGLLGTVVAAAAVGIFFG